MRRLYHLEFGIIIDAIDEDQAEEIANNISDYLGRECAYDGTCTFEGPIECDEDARPIGDRL
jgi:hypothetical protein